MIPSHHLDLAKLCSMSYQQPEKVQENFTNRDNLSPDNTLSVLQKCRKIPSFLESQEDCEVYICDYQETITICFRGTESIADILTDLKISQITFVIPGLEIWNCPQVHRGFYQQFESVRKEIEKHLDTNKHKNVIFTGHSLGGALATLASLYFSPNFTDKNISCVTFGSPRVGDSKFGELFNKYVNQSYRYVNDNDPVPCIPTTWRFIHVPGLIWLNEDKIQKEITVWRFYRFMKNTMMSWFGYGYNALDDHSCESYIHDLKTLSVPNSC